MSKRAIGNGLYRDEKGKLWIRPWIEGKRTWRRTSSSEHYSRLTPPQEHEEFVESACRWLNRVPAPTTIPECLREYADRLGEIIIPPIGTPGIYFLMNGDQCVYVGQSRTRVAGRIAQHVKNKMFDRVIVMHAELHELDAMEQYFIAVMAPKYNRAGVFGREVISRHTDLVDLNPMGSGKVDTGEFMQAVEGVVRPE
jgi:hypothetical protein